jgi:hypothetical protein
MKRMVYVAVGVAGAVALAVSVTTGACASAPAAPSPTTIYEQTQSGSLFIGASNDPTTILDISLPVGSWHVEVVSVVSNDQDYGGVAMCNLKTTASTDTINANQGVAGPTSDNLDTADINGTVTVTQSSDHVSVSCYASEYSMDTLYAISSSLTAQPVSKVKS